MFAHQVVETVRSIQRNNPNLKGKARLSWVEENIIKSQKFHLGNIPDIISVFDRKIKVGDKLFYGNNSEYCKLPYQICWFDWLDEYSPNIQKHGALVIELFPDFLLMEWFHFAFGVWTYSTFSEYVLVGDKINNRNDVRQFLLEMGIPNEYIDDYYIRAKRIGMDREVDLAFEDMDKHNPFIINIALLLLNCRNINKNRIFPPENLNKKRVKIGRQPIFSYYTLALKPVGKKQESIPKHLWENGIHLARGHFKTYTEKNPLFGCVTGRFWWQPQVRGRNHSRIIMKDYELRPN